MAEKKNPRDSRFKNVILKHCVHVYVWLYFSDICNEESLRSSAEAPESRGPLMSWPLRSKLPRHYLSHWMPQESWNNLVPQQQKMHKRKEQEFVCVCVCVRVRVSVCISGRGEKCVWLAVLQQCSCHPICPPVTRVLFSQPEQHAQTEAGTF